MTATPPSRISIPPRPSGADVFGSSTTSPADPSSTHTTRRLPSRSLRPSFSTAGGGRRRVSRAPLGGLDDLDADEANAKLPTLVPGIRTAYSTPLPVLPMVVLCIAMLSELLSANLCTPFLLPMVEGFFANAGWEEGSEREATVGLWTGNLVSVFFITQFFTSLLWSSIADRHGRRAVIVASLAGSAVALTTFGTSESLPEAICIRLVQGIFGGAVGVFRGSIRDVTDETNATRAYAMLGFSWGFGGVIGPILGGVFESPAKNFPGTFLANIPLFQKFRYLLPTFLAGIILSCGAVLACFLSWDGGVRRGPRIALPVEKTETENEPAEIERSVSPVPSHHATIRTIKNKRSMILSPGIEESTGMSTSVKHNRRDSRASLGTAYGYGGIRSKHPTLAARAALEAARRVSAIQQPDDGEDSQEDEEEEERRPNFAQRLLLANEENTFNINDLWVSAAVAQDTAVFDDEEDEEYEDTTPNERDDDDEEEDDDITPQNSPGLGTFPPNSGSMRRNVRQRIVSGNSLRAPSQGAHRLSVSRRFSTASGNVPAIFGNTGLLEPAPISLGDDESDPFYGTPQSERRQPPLGGLSVIAEGRPAAHERSPLMSPNTEMHLAEKPVSTWKSLPLMMIVQYGLVALHNTTHDQLFLAFLVTPYKSGGIGLNPARFSLLIAMMCICQLFYQFYLYPRLGPPLGKFNHLQMFRIGCFLYIPAYLSLPLLRSVASPDSDGGIIVMTLLTMITAVRYCGGTLAYTAVMILINAMSPPHVVGLANGLAQSTVSFARFFGPVIGGAVWSASINGNPQGYASGFYVVTILCLVQWALSFLIR